MAAEEVALAATVSILFKKTLISLQKFSFMETHSSTLVNTVAYYDPLLQRYARRLIQNEEAAAVMVQDVLEGQFQINGLVPAKHLR
jgi:hypothetical protein